MLSFSSQSVFGRWHIPKLLSTPVRFKTEPFALKSVSSLKLLVPGNPSSSPWSATLGVPLSLAVLTLPELLRCCFPAAAPFWDHTSLPNCSLAEGLGSFEGDSDSPSSCPQHIPVRSSLGPASVFPFPSCCHHEGSLLDILFPSGLIPNLPGPRPSSALGSGCLANPNELSGHSSLS